VTAGIKIPNPSTDHFSVFTLSAGS